MTARRAPGRAATRPAITEHGRRLRRIEIDAIRTLCEVPEALTVTEWSDRERMLPETSTSPGPYDSSVTPYARRPQDLLADPSTTCVVLCWAAQTTKSTVLENGLAYRIVRMPSPMVVVQPKIDAAEGWAKERLVPMIVATPALRERVRLGKGTDSTLRYKRFPGGFVFVGSAQSATELASRSAPFVLCDEVDRYEAIPGEGNPVEIVARRQGAADIGLLALTSTPRDAETTVIWPYLEGGTFELYHVPCPHCGHMQPLLWQGLRWDAGRPETAHYVCGGLRQGEDGTPDGCGAVIEESDKADMLAAGEWVAQNPDAPYPSFHLNALYSPFAKSGWSSLASEWERAQGKAADLQVFVNTRLAELWKESSEQLDPNALAERLDAHEEGTVPAGVGLLTAGIDVQQGGGGRLEWYVWGWGAGMESWLVASGIIDGDPLLDTSERASPWRLLDELWTRTWAHESGMQLRIERAAIDSGYATTQVYRYVSSRRGRYPVMATKGIGESGRPILGKATLAGRERVPLFPVGVDAAKTEFLRSQLPEQKVGPGYVHLPEWISTDQLEQMVAEKRKRFIDRGRVGYRWVRKRDDLPNEALDCRILARVALEHLGAKVIAGLGVLAERHAAQAAATAPDGQRVAAPVTAPRRGGRRVLSKGVW